jgi:hypothetical protein
MDIKDCSATIPLDWANCDNAANLFLSTNCLGKGCMGYRKDTQAGQSMIGAPVGRTDFQDEVDRLKQGRSACGEA